MSIYAKLQAARIELQNTAIKKSGENKFAGYKYFELGDYLPSINVIFQNNGLCGVISFDASLATLTIYEFEGDGKIVVTSPMSDAPMKGTLPVQQLGAVLTYIRRYLWQAAMEIVEHDAVDASEPVKASTTVHNVPKQTLETMDNDERKFLEGIANEVKEMLASGLDPDAAAHLEAQKLDAEEKVAIWALFDSKQRAAIKKANEFIKSQKAA